MKPKIHPAYHAAVIHCVCGADLETGSTVKEITVEICAHCHPFYTGKKKVIDTTGRVDRFKKMAEKATTIQAAKKPKKIRAKKQESAEKDSVATETEK